MVAPKAGKNGTGRGTNKPKPSKTVVDRASKHQRNRASNNRMFGATGGFPGVNVGMVRKLINQTVKPELMSMRDDRQFINRQAGDAITDANNLYSRSVGDLNYVFGEAGDYINHLGQQVNQNYSDTASRVAGQDAAAGNAIGQTADATTQAIQAQLAAQGLGAAPIDPRIQADAAFAKNIQSQQAANNQANIAMQQQSANTLSGMLGGMIQGSKVSNLGQANQQHVSSVNDINRAKREDLATVNDAMQQLRMTKPGMIREMLLQLQAQGFDQWSALQNLNMQRRQMNHGFAMDNAQMAQQNAYYGTSAQAWGSQAGASGGSAAPSSTSWSSPSGSSNGPIKLAGPAANPSWTPNPPKPPKPPKKGGKNGGRNGGPRGGGPSGSSNVDAIYGPLW